MSRPGLRSLTRKLWLLLLPALLAGLAGCEDSARRTVQAHPPQIANPAAAAQNRTVLAAASAEPLPALMLDHRRSLAPALAAQKPDGIEWLAAHSRAAFDSSEEDYRAGRLGKAREELDQALADLLNSGFDVPGEPRLSELYRTIVESAHADELDAFREQKATPAPIDEIAEGMPEPEALDPNLRGRAEGEVHRIHHDLPLTVNDHVLTYLNYFKSPRGSAIVETGLRRAGRYRKMVERVLREEGMPQDLIYLAQAESAFQPQAVSKAGARGMWQFMSFAGRKYGLEKTWWVDDRQDPEKSTRAAARDLRDLYRQFGDWYLAMAAYNSGAGAVQHAIERTGYADFWELYRRNALPQETRNYVPIILALTLISKDPARYGIEFHPDPPLQSDAVKLSKPIDLRLVAETIDADLETLRTLNPQLLRLVTPAQGEFVLRLPQGAGGRFLSDIAAIPPENWLSWRRHKVEEGESLSSIARRYHVPQAEIVNTNDLPAGGELEEGQKLIIPVSAHASAASGKLVRYRVRRGDTIASIADEFDVSPVELRKWNHLKRDTVSKGMRLKIHPGGLGPPSQVAHGEPRPRAVMARRSADAPVIEARHGSGPGAGSSRMVHRVKAGETLWSIARAYRTTVDGIRSANRYLFSRPLQVGDTLTILPAR